MARAKQAPVSVETIEVPESLVGKRDTYVLRVRGDSMIDEQIRDGDLVIVEDRRTADNGETVVALLPGAPPLPEGIRAGAATAPDPLGLPTALEQARTALRLAADVGGLAPAVIRHEDLGALAVIAERISAEEAAEVGDVRRLEDLLAGHPWVVETLHAVLDQPSLRQSAAMLHGHHSTLQERLAWLSTQLGYSPVKGRGRQRAAVAVLLWRVAHGTDEQVVEDPH